MPTYCYRRDDTGEIEEVDMSFASHQRRQKKGRLKLADGVMGTRDFRAEHTRTDGTGDRAYPILSDAMGVHPDQVGVAREHAKRHDVQTDFTRDGRPVLRDRKHRKRYAELIGMFDRNAGHGDPVPR